MSTDFLPGREADLLTWSVNFKTKITAAPADYGLSAPLANEYWAKHDAFAAAYQKASDPDKRSPSAIVAKDTAKKTLIDFARRLARIVQAFPAITAQQKSDLRLTMRETDPSPIPAPAVAPDIDIVSATGRTVKIRLHNAASASRRAKPDGVAGASVFSFVGAQPPAYLADWKFVSNTTRTTLDVEFDATVPNGATVWLTGYWFNPRAQSGPACNPVSTNIPGGMAMAA